ncbi:hypothetical protein HY384_03060 [Candidatus Daviesbacteria bacterium]|nr:hypothetical protein [Candidatus Daviesbacteria bacterium]
MIVKPLRSDLQKYLKKHHLSRKFNKQIALFSQNPRHPSLNTEILEPKSLKIYSFRIDRKYRVIFITKLNEAEIIDMNDHYQ